MFVFASLIQRARKRTNIQNCNEWFLSQFPQSPNFNLNIVFFFRYPFFVLFFSVNAFFFYMRWGSRWLSIVNRRKNWGFFYFILCVIIYVPYMDIVHRIVITERLKRDFRLLKRERERADDPRSAIYMLDRNVSRIN